MIRLRKIGISVVKLRKISSFNGVQLLQPKLREKLFRQAAADPNETKMREISDSLKRFGQIDVEAFNLRSKTKSSQSDWFVKLLADFPSLEGNSLDDHFRSIANAQIQPYLAALKDFCQSQVPSKPSEWRRSPGWTRYGSDFPNGASVEFPNESALVFDCEVSVKVGQNPIVAVALSPSAW